MIEAQDAVTAERIDGGDCDFLIAAEAGQDIGRWILVPVDFASVQRGRSGRNIGKVEPFDPIDLGDLATRSKARRLLAWDVIRVLDEHCLASRYPFLLGEF